MKLFLSFIFLAFACVAFADISKLSLPEAVNALHLADQIDAHNVTAKLVYKNVTGIEYATEQRDQLLNIILLNSEQKGFAAKLAGLVTFQNVILTLAVFVGLALVISIAKDLIVKLLLNKSIMYALGLVLSGSAMFLKPGYFNNPVAEVFFFFDWLTPLFGCLLFGVVASVMYFDLFDDDDISHYNRRYNRSSESNPLVTIGSLITFVWFVVTLYQNNWLVGVFTVIALFAVCGFAFGAMFGGYYTGFFGHEQMIRCLVISIVLNLFMVGIQTEVITGPITKYAMVFETGIQFWGTLVGSIAMLILTDRNYVPYSFNNKKERALGYFYYFVAQICMSVYCLTTMYFGSVLYISSFKSIGGTFLVLWSLHFEYSCLKRLSTGWLTMTLIVVLANLWGIYKYSVMFPEYFITGLF